MEKGKEIWILEQDREPVLFFYDSKWFHQRNRKENMKDFLLETYTIILPVLLGYIVWLLKRQKRDRDANSKGTMLLLRVQMIEYHDLYCAKGSIPSYAYENFAEMYDAYRALGGNGMIVKMKEEIDNLEIRKKGEK